MNFLRDYFIKNDVKYENLFPSNLNNDITFILLFIIVNKIYETDHSLDNQMTFNRIKNICLKYLNSLKTFSFKTYIKNVVNKFYDKEKLLLKNGKINPKFVCENFDDFLSIYGLNSQSILRTHKIWNIFLVFCFIAHLIKFIIAFIFDPIKDFNYLIYLGDITLIFQALRKYLLIFIILIFSVAFHVNYLFNYNEDIEWQEVFKCLNGQLSPESIGVKDKKILIKVLIFTKIAFKIIKLSNILLYLMIICFCLPLSCKKLYFKIVNDILLLISTIFWYPTLFFILYYLIGTLIVSTICFQIICFYCFINSRYFNNSLKKFAVNSYGSKRIRRKMINLIRKQHHFSNRILKYNQFWSGFYLLVIIHILPANLICLQQSLFGDLSSELRTIFIITFLFGIILIVPTSLFVCLLARDMKVYSKLIYQLQLAPNLNLNVKTKIKVSID